MPMCRRKRVVLVEPSAALLAQVTTKPDKQVFYLEQTGEIFEDYDTYAARMSFYRLKQFQCEVTGKSNMDYFEALKSEMAEGRIMHRRFPEPLKAAVLRSVQWQVMGRLDHLVEAVYERFKDRYFEGEKIFVDLQGDKFFANVLQVFPPRDPVSNGHPPPPPTNGDVSMSPKQEMSISTPSLPPNPRPVHHVTGDLKLTAAEAMAGDEPAKYIYKIQIIEDQNERSHDKSKTSAKERAKYSGSVMDVQCPVMSRDRLTFSKSILRRFIRDCVDRDAAVASPWTVKPVIAKRFGIETEMPEDTRRGVEDTKEAAMDKRKKIVDEKDGPLLKKPRKLTAAQQEKADKRERDALERAEKQASVKEEAERIAAEKKKKKPVRYPTEDLDVNISERDKKAGLTVKRPAPSRVALPFGGRGVSMDSLLFAWNFLNIYGGPLHLSPFTLDEFENALRHSDPDTPCPLLAEMHSALIYNLRTVPFVRHSAVISLLRRQQANANDNIDVNGEVDDVVLGIGLEQISATISDIGNNWERAPLRVGETRQGWEDSLIGCLKDHATLENFPRMREVMTQLLYAPEPTDEPSPSSSAGSRHTTPELQPHVHLARPSERYYELSPSDRVEIVAFMCNQAVNSKSIHTHMEVTEEQLTALRKEKVEVNRLRKQLTEELAQSGITPSSTALPATLENAGANVPQPTEDEPADEDFAMAESSDLSDVPSDNENGSETTSVASGLHRSNSRRDLRQRVQKEAASKAASKSRSVARTPVVEQRKPEDELKQLERRLEAIEREFRQLLGAVRCKPIGRDRFYNRMWWFDGMGSATLVATNGAPLYGTGRLFVQGPSETDADVLARRPKSEIQRRRMDEEGPDGMLKTGEWAVYTDVEELDELMAWLNVKGHREIALKNQLTKWWNYITPGFRKRITDVNSTPRVPDGRRSSRKGRDVTREPYMLWANRRAQTST